MRAYAGAAFVTLVVASGCGGYWKARPAGDTAPVTWGDTTAARDAGTAPQPIRHGSLGVEERFLNLEKLRREGVIGPEEYRQRRQDVLRQAFE